jgi:hypothetical protein
MRSVRLILAAALLAIPSASFAAGSAKHSASKYFVVLSDVFGASASKYAGPYASKTACQSDAKAFQAKAGSSPSVYVCALYKKAEIDALTDKERQELKQAMLDGK